MQVATGEMCQNRILFKQFIMRGAIDVVQIDACRLGGVNEVLAVLLMAAKYGLPVCPHAGGVGLCEYVQHLSMIDYLCIAGTQGGPGDRVCRSPARAFRRSLRDPRTRPTCRRARPGYSIEMKPAVARASYTLPRT